VSGRRRPRTTRAGEGQLSLLAGILTETDRVVLELARGTGLQARVAAQAQRLLGISPARYFQLLDRPEAADAEPELSPAAGGARPTPPVASQTVATEPRTGAEIRCR